MPAKSSMSRAGTYSNGDGSYAADGNIAGQNQGAPLMRAGCRNVATWAAVCVAAVALGIALMIWQP
jgi:hypothetical protein